MLNKPIGNYILLIYILHFHSVDLSCIERDIYRENNI